MVTIEIPKTVVDELNEARDLYHAAMLRTAKQLDLQTDDIDELYRQCEEIALEGRIY